MRKQSRKTPRDKSTRYIAASSEEMNCITQDSVKSLKTLLRRYQRVLSSYRLATVHCVDAAEIGQKPANGPQGWLSNTVQKITNHKNDAVLCIHHIKGNKPAENSGNYQTPDVEVDDGVDQREEHGEGIRQGLRQERGHDEFSDLEVR